MPLLEVQGVSVRYGQVSALDDVSLVVEPGEIVALIGSNGAGKSSMLRAVMGLVPIAEGAIRFDGTTISGAETATIVRRGITLSPEGRRVFPEMSVEENLLVGGFTSAKGDLQASVDLIFESLPVLKSRRRQVAGTLSGGEQQMLALGRALMARPKLMLLDEPSLGLAPLIVREVTDIIMRLNRELEMAVLLAEQNASLALSASQRGYVLQTGSVVHEDSSARLREDSRVRSAYMGV